MKENVMVGCGLLLEPFGFHNQLEQYMYTQDGMI
jgi:hypothetical protein